MCNGINCIIIILSGGTNSAEGFNGNEFIPENFSINIYNKQYEVEPLSRLTYNRFEHNENS